MPEKTLLEVSGSVEDVIFKNEQNGYTVIEINTGTELITAVGVMPLLSAGEKVRLVGGWVNNPNYGQQFQAEAFERSEPETAGDMLKYLSSGAVKGIGPGLAKRIVESFGEDSLKIIETKPQRLCSIKGITTEKAQKIYSEFKRVSGIRQMILNLSKYGILPSEAVRIWKMYGANSIEHIQEDPYCLCGHELGISFGRADKIAASLDLSQDDRCRVRAGIIFVLRHNAKNGHTCLPSDKLLPASANMLKVDESLTADTLDELKNDNSVVSKIFHGREFIFTPDLYRSEIYSAGRLQMMLHYPAPSITGIEGMIEEIEKQLCIKYADGQKFAIEEALSKGMLILTGGPGTGKTTTLKAIINILEAEGQKVLLAAPTGRAAKRMADLTGKEAKTIHRLLQVEWDASDNPAFAKNEKNLLKCDALIIDELSMVDTCLFEAVLRALPLGCRLVMVGDCNQLPSVGPGNVLGDLISCGLVPVVELNRIFRQSMSSLIVTNAHKIVNGQMPDLTTHTSDFFFLPCTNQQNICETVADICSRRLPKSYGFSPFTDIQILSPGRKGRLGVKELNIKLQQSLNPPEHGKQQINFHGTTFREGDKVMQIKNDYDLPWTRDDGTYGEGVFNGDMGILIKINKRASTMTVLMDNRTIEYSSEKIPELEIAYAMTVHKSQGNEFPAVIMPLYMTAPQLMYRNLLYTAVTRAKSLLILVGSSRILRIMIANDKKTKRYTGLRHLIAGETENGM